MILISLPLIALAILIAYLLGKWQNHLAANLSSPTDELARSLNEAANTPRGASRPINWKVAMLSTVRYLAFGLVLPLAAIHLWLATAHEGLGAAVRKLRTHLARAFAPQSVLIYIAGFLIFGVVPYFLLFRTTQTKHAWIEVLLLATRLVVVFALTLFGWVVTVRALAHFSAAPAEPANEAA